MPVLEQHDENEEPTLRVVTPEEALRNPESHILTGKDYEVGATEAEWEAFFAALAEL